MSTIMFKQDSKLSNYYECKVVYMGMVFNSSEAAYQSQKFMDVPMQLRFIGLTPDESKNLARRWKKNWRLDWNTYKVNVMYEVVKAKMIQNQDCMIELLNTGNSIIVEDTTGWHDNVWGYCRCDKCKHIPHQNYLGIVLMNLRDEFRSGGVIVQ